MNTEDYLPDLARIASYMKRLRKSEQAIVKYEILSDSLVWSDEFPRETSLNTDCLRFVFRYRTSLILGDPDKPYEMFWKQGLQQFPDWIGFAPERTSENFELKNFYLREKERVLKELDDG